MKSTVVRKIAFVSVIVMLSACQKNMQKHQNKALQLQESVARLSEIPDTPLHVVIQKVLKSEQNPDNLQIFCEFSKMPRNDLKSFYMGEMERLGWKLDAEYEGMEHLLNFSKPDGSICLLSFRDKHQLVITLIKKKEML